MPVTPRQREIYDYLCCYVDARGQAPTLAEIGAHFKLSSPASVHHLLSGLERGGLIRRIPNARRGIEVVREESPEQDLQIPLLGLVTAGRPIEAVLSNETIAVPRDMLGRGRTFALRVRGDSMIDDQICNGDYIVVESRQTAENGETVIALIDGSEATVKRFYRDRNQVRLEPANPNYEPIIVKPADRLSIQGVVRGVIRKYL
jgi:SOS regulatory protein LexA